MSPQSEMENLRRHNQALIEENEALRERLAEYEEIIEKMQDGIAFISGHQRKRRDR